MEPGAGRILCKMRRFKWEALSLWSDIRSQVYDPTRATPDERRFELLDGSDNNTGRLEYAEFTPIKTGWGRGKASTPWGEAIISEGGGFLTLVLGENVIATINPHLPGYDLSFPGGQVMPLKNRPGNNFLTWTGDTGALTIPQERGMLPESNRHNATRPSKAELDSLPADKRHRPVESDHYTQWSIQASGILPAAENDIVVSLVMLISFFDLNAEMPTRR